MGLVFNVAFMLYVIIKNSQVKFCARMDQGSNAYVEAETVAQSCYDMTNSIDSNVKGLHSISHALKPTHTMQHIL